MTVTGGVAVLTVDSTPSRAPAVAFPCPLLVVLTVDPTPRTHGPSTIWVNDLGELLLYLTGSTLARQSSGDGVQQFICSSGLEGR